MNRIYYAMPSITAREVGYATDAAAKGWGERCYDYIDRFERSFAQKIRVAHAIATSSATGALQMGLTALGIGEGDEVILGDINWIASAAPIVHCGATPIFVDVLPDSWCLDPARVEQAVTPRTKAILAVHLYGNLCDMDALLALGQRLGVPIVEDAAEAIGSEHRGRPAGSMGTFGAFSFHGTKTITTGEGGMLTTQDPVLFERVLTLSNHGRARGETSQFWAGVIGFKFKMSNVQAAIGCAQVERWDELVARKREIFEWYSEDLAGLPITMNPEPDGVRNGFWMPTIIFDESIALDRDVLLARFREEQIDGRVFFWPLSMLPMFEACRHNETSYSLFKRAINLPSYHDMTRRDAARVADVVRQTLARASPVPRSSGTAIAAPPED